MQIAIVGMACRFPGAPDITGFWKLLREGRSGIGPLPDRRWDDAAILDDDPAAPGKSCVRVAGYLNGIDGFDALFFGISPREAQWMDPQQRLILETVYEAVEDAGIPIEQLSGSRTAVYVGSCSNDYELLVCQPAIVESLSDPYAPIGISPNVMSGRVSYCFNLRGPSMTVDTACSSSLVAVHLACKGLEDGEATLALAVGVNIIASPLSNILLSKPKGIALDGVCRAFDARGSGTVRGEGAGVVLLKPLDAAIRDGDPIYAVIRGTAVLQDGRTNGLSAPNGAAQQDVIRAALRRAGISARDLRYVEAHGTGTPLGDPIELMALGSVLAEGTDARDPCGVGSVKTNIGHLEGAAGIAGLIKAALVLKHGEVPASLNFERPSPNVPLDRLPLKVVGERVPLEGSATAAVGVSSFGWSGTNAHAILSAAPAEEPAPVTEEARLRMLPLSARTKSALVTLAGEVEKMLRRGTDRWDRPASVADLCYSAGLRRAHHGYRLAVIGATAEALAESLQRFGHGEADSRVSEGRRKPNHAPKIAFVFSGHGGQWHGMARELLACEPVFRAGLARIDTEARSQGWPSPLEELERGADAERLRRADVALPVSFAFQVALAALLRDWGVCPDAVVGHSAGEIGAAHVAGALSLADAVRLVYARSRLLASASGAGAMLLAELSVPQAQAALAGESAAWIGVNNGKRSCTLCGDRAALERVALRLENDGTFFRWLRAEGAGHCPLVDPLLPSLRHAIGGLIPQPASIPFYSTVNGARAGGEELGVGYWLSNMRERVRFSETFEHMVTDGFDAFVEISPHPILSSAMEDDLAQVRKHARVLPALRRKEPEREGLLRLLAQLYVLGTPVNLQALCASKGRVVALPLYPWERKRYWLPQMPAARAPSSSAGDLLGPRIDIADSAALPAALDTAHTEVSPDSDTASLAAEVPLSERIASCETAERRQELVSEFLRTTLAAVLGCDVTQIEPHQPLAELGLDSILGMQVRNRIESALGLQLSAAIVFRYPTVHALAAFISQHALGDGDVGAANIDVRTQMPAAARMETA